jgi:uncharacterized membrane protein
VSFLRPGLLLLLPVVIAAITAALWLLPARERRKRFFSLCLRGGILVLLMLALAGLKLDSGGEGRAVCFLVDVSDSIPADHIRSVDAWLSMARTKRRSDDLEQVILFADGAAVEVPFGVDTGTAVDLTRPRARIEREATDLAGAIRLARSSFPEGPDRRIVLVTDGNENRGEVILEARRATGDGIDLAVLPVDYRRTEEISVLRVDAVSSAPSMSVVTFVPILSSTTEDAPATVHAFVNGQPIGIEELTLARGKTRGPEFRVQVGLAGIYELSVSVEAEADTIRRNNEAKASVRVAGEAGILVIDSETGTESHIAAALRSMDLPVIEKPPSALFESPFAYQPYDAVVLSDISALDINSAQLAALEVAVRDLGVGCLVLGGEQAYGPGGYRNTALERLLPVEMEVRQKQVLLNGALVLILHTCEFQNGNYWAERIAKDSILTLNADDYAGLVVYGPKGDQWALPLQPVVDAAALADKITNLPAGDMPSFDGSLRLATESLIDCPAHLKHIVVISDGDAAQPDPKLVGRITAEKITVSTVCVAPHGQNDSKTMAQLARWGNGRAYDIKAGEVESLPRIFIKEATTLRRTAVSRKPFVPEFTAAPGDLPPMLRGFGDALPSLGTYTVVGAKDRAEVPIVTPDGDPVLAIWRYGLGESAAFTSAMKGGWIGQWAAWADLERFFAQVVRGILRKADRSGFLAEATSRGGVATVRMSAFSEGQDAVDFLEVTGLATHGNEPSRPFAVHQKGGGVYEGSFPVRGEGMWIAVLRYPDPETGRTAQLEVPVAVSYPEEFADLSSNAPLFRRLQDEAGARLIEAQTDVFAGVAEGRRASRDLSPWLLLLAALILPIDVYVRRVRPDFSGFWSKISLPRLPKRKERVAVLPEVPDFEPQAEASSAADTAPTESPAAGPAEDIPETKPLKDLLKAKKRARDRRLWEETGNE